MLKYDKSFRKKNQKNILERKNCIENSTKNKYLEKVYWKDFRKICKIDNYIGDKVMLAGKIYKLWLKLIIKLNIKKKF